MKHADKKLESKAEAKREEKAMRLEKRKKGERKPKER